MDDEYLRLIQSERVAPRTRKVLLDRIGGDGEAAVANRLSATNLAVLQAVVDRLIPQKADSEFVHIARLLDFRIQTSAGDGWRFADMPPDALALEAGLVSLDATSRRLHGATFNSLNPTQQDDLLRQVQRGEIAWPELNARHWFEDLIADATEIYVSHPSILAQMGFSGIAFMPRWAKVGLGTTQPWEPTGR